MAIGITNDETDDPETPEPVNEDDEGLMQLKMLQEWLGWAPSTRRWLIQTIMSGIEKDGLRHIEIGVGKSRVERIARPKSRIVRTGARIVWRRGVFDGG